MSVNGPILCVACAAAVLAGVAAPARRNPPNALLDSAAAAMGGLERLQRVENFASHRLRPAALLRRRRQRHRRRERAAEVARRWPTRSARSTCAARGRVYQERWASCSRSRRRSATAGIARPRCRPAATCSTIRCPRCSRRSIPETTLGAVTIEDGMLRSCSSPSEDGTPLWIGDRPRHASAERGRAASFRHANLGDVASPRTSPATRRSPACSCRSAS